jgi:hypothetical protein
MTASNIVSRTPPMLVPGAEETKALEAARIAAWAIRCLPIENVRDRQSRDVASATTAVRHIVALNIA